MRSIIIVWLLFLLLLPSDWFCCWLNIGSGGGGVVVVLVDGFVINKDIKYNNNNYRKIRCNYYKQTSSSFMVVWNMKKDDDINNHMDDDDNEEEVTKKKGKKQRKEIIEEPISMFDIRKENESSQQLFQRLLIFDSISKVTSAILYTFVLFGILLNLSGYAYIVPSKNGNTLDLTNIKIGTIQEKRFQIEINKQTQQQYTNEQQAPKKNRIE